jgi:hypothetical protein
LLSRPPLITLARSRLHTQHENIDHIVTLHIPPGKGARD